MHVVGTLFGLLACSLLTYSCAEVVFFDASQPFTKCCPFDSSKKDSFIVIKLDNRPLAKLDISTKKIDLNDKSFQAEVKNVNELCVSKTFEGETKFDLNCFEADQWADSHPIFNVSVASFLEPQVANFTFDPFLNEASVATCVAAGFPNLFVELSDGQKSFNNSQNKANVVKMPISVVTETVELTCTARTDKSHQTKTVKFSAQQRPKIEAESNTVSVVLNKNADFAVTVLGKPKPTFNCTDAVQIREKFVSQFETKYTVSVLPTQDGFQFTCEAVNVYGRDARTFTSTLAPEKPQVVPGFSEPKADYYNLFFHSRSGYPIENVTVKWTVLDSRSKRDAPAGLNALLLNPRNQTNDFTVKQADHSETVYGVHLKGLNPNTTYSLDLKVCNQFKCSETTVPSAFKTPASGDIVDKTVVESPPVIPVALMQQMGSGDRLMTSLILIAISQLFVLLF